MFFGGRTTLISMMILPLLVSCTFNPFSSDNELTGNPGAAAIGGVAGVGTTAMLGASKPLIGLAGVGGASIGYYVTTLRFASGGVIQSGGNVYTIGDYATIEIPSDRLFDPNTAELLPEATPILDSAVAVLNRYPDHNIMISGNTSGFGNRRYEQRLSQKRAEKIAAYLWGHGISSYKFQSNDTRRLIYVGYGNYFPIANNLKAQSVRANSRIQITAYPSKAQLELDKKHTVFGNIGATESPPTQYPPQTDMSNAFKGERLPEQSGPSLDDFKDSLTETNTTTTAAPDKASDYYSENYDYKDESPLGNNAKSAAHTAAGTSPLRQGGYKGEANFKDD